MLILVAVAAVVSFAVSTRRGINNTIRGSYAAWWVADMCIEHMKANGVSHCDIHEDSEINLSPRVVAEVRAKADEGRTLLLDGFVITAADTPENQEAYPQNAVQAEGVGFPILRCVTLTSSDTGMLFDHACGPRRGINDIACPTALLLVRS